MKFLSKNLSWGVFQDAVGTGSLVSRSFTTTISIPYSGIT